MSKQTAKIEAVEVGDFWTVKLIIKHQSFTFGIKYEREEGKEGKEQAEWYAEMVSGALEKAGTRIEP